jgi:hypothetical protein
MVIAPEYTGEAGSRDQENVAGDEWPAVVYRAIRRIDWTPFEHAHIVARALQLAHDSSLSESEAAWYWFDALCSACS